MNVQELTKKLNEFREKNKGKTYTSEQLYSELQAIGFNASISKRVAALMPAEKVGTAKLYSMPEDPIHQARIAALYESAKRSQLKYKGKTHKEKPTPLTEKAALELLQSKGYRIKKVVKFDMERFMKEQQEMYRRYCIYEYI